MSGNRTDIDINDPDFWKKWAKKADVDVEGIKHKVQYGCSFSYMYMQTLLYLQYVQYIYKCSAPTSNVCGPYI